MVTDLWRVSAKIDTSRLHSVLWHSTCDMNIATPISVFHDFLSDVGKLSSMLKQQP